MHQEHSTIFISLHVYEREAPAWRQIWCLFFSRTDNAYGGKERKRYLLKSTEIIYSIHLKEWSQMHGCFFFFLSRNDGFSRHPAHSFCDISTNIYMHYTTEMWNKPTRDKKNVLGINSNDGNNDWHVHCTALTFLNSSNLGTMLGWVHFTERDTELKTVQFHKITLLVSSRLGMQIKTMTFSIQGSLSTPLHVASRLK